MSKKALIYEAVYKHGAASLKEVALTVGCHNTYVHELTERDESLRLKIRDNKLAKKAAINKEMKSEITRLRGMGYKWKEIYDFTGYSKAQCARALRYDTGQTC